MTKCDDCRTARTELANAEFVKKLLTILIVLIVAIVINNIAWIIAWCQYDYVSYEVTASDGNANYVGGNGDILNSEGGDIERGIDQGKETD